MCPEAGPGIFGFKCGDFYSMIDLNFVNKAYQEDGFYSLQLEVGDKCYQGCVYCYMSAVGETKNQLTSDLVFKVLRDAANEGISAIEWLGGEPLLRPDIFRFMEYAQKLGFRNNMWTGGLPFADKQLTGRTADLCRHGLISVHLSTIDPETYQRMHPSRSADDIQVILDGIRHLLDLGYPPDQLLNSVTFTGLQTADDMIETMQFFYDSFQIQTSINVYHTYLRPDSHTNELQRFIPDPEEVAKVYRAYRKMIGERTLPMNCVNKAYCSATVAVLNNAYVTPCATIREEKAGLNLNEAGFSKIMNMNRDYLCFKYLKDESNLPEDCRRCKLRDDCWGCRSRSYAAGQGIYGKDPRCFRMGTSA